MEYQHTERFYPSRHLNGSAMLIESNGHEIDLAAFTTASSNRYGISPRVQHLLLGQPVHERMLVHEYLVHKALLLSCIIEPPRSGLKYRITLSMRNPPYIDLASMPALSTPNLTKAPRKPPNRFGSSARIGPRDICTDPLARSQQQR